MTEKKTYGEIKTMLEIRDLLKENNITLRRILRQLEGKGVYRLP